MNRNIEHNKAIQDAVKLNNKLTNLEWESMKTVDGKLNPYPPDVSAKDDDIEMGDLVKMTTFLNELSLQSVDEYNQWMRRFYMGIAVNGSHPGAQLDVLLRASIM